MEGLDAPIVVGSPAAVLVAADFAFVEMAGKETYTETLEFTEATEKKALGMRHGGGAID